MSYSVADAGFAVFHLGCEFAAPEPRAHGLAGFERGSVLHEVAGSVEYQRIATREDCRGR